MSDGHNGLVLAPVRDEARSKFRSQMAVGLRVAAAILLVPIAVDAMVPASLWYELNAVHVDDAVQGGPIPVRVERDIHRPFLGEYVVSVRPIGLAEPVCNGGQRVAYQRSASSEVNQTLDYWASGALPPCTAALGPGRYILSTTIIVDTRIPFVPRRVVTRHSNVFSILPKEAL